MKLGCSMIDFMACGATKTVKTTYELGCAMFDGNIPGACRPRDVARRWPHLFSEKLCDLDVCRLPEVKIGGEVVWVERELGQTVFELLEHVEPHVAVPNLAAFKAAVIAHYVGMQQYDEEARRFHAPVLERLSTWPDGVWEQLLALAKASNEAKEVAVVPTKRTHCVACGDACRWSW
jgi:hypothetical protein